MIFRRTKKPGSALDISPLIDVVLQLLIFFMLSSTFMSPRIEVALPESETSDGTADPRQVVVTADGRGDLYVNSDRVEPGALAVTLENALAASDLKSVTFRGDASVPLRTVVEVIDAARRAGADAFDIAHATSPAEPSEPGGGAHDR